MPPTGSRTAHPRSRGENLPAWTSEKSPWGSSPLTRGKPPPIRAPPAKPWLIPAHAGKTRAAVAARVARWAHPRSRGENTVAASRSATALGSSPLTRGKHRRTSRARGGCGLIPAHAGKTLGQASGAHVARAHPRSRGENRQSLSSRRDQEGSSPLTRGKRRTFAPRQRGRGLIPAHAGKTPPRKPPWTSTWAHPRSRGENRAFAALETAILGSSPLTRGKHRRTSRARGGCGLIPAHAGKTGGEARLDADRGAHPRSRGENSTATTSKRTDAGSSPLTRGKHRPCAVYHFLPGLIPAHAGKTPSHEPCCTPPRAHPRSRGENAVMNHPAAAALGSSPLTRGKLERAAELFEVAGLIPAHAGKTPGLRSRTCPARAHPRSRGENLVGDGLAGGVEGSSPLTRGKRPPWSRRSFPWRLIPAHAGKTRCAPFRRPGRPAHPRSRGENGARESSHRPAPGSSPLTRGKQAHAPAAQGLAGLIPAHAGKTSRQPVAS